jgi:hypothetical protein
MNDIRVTQLKNKIKVEANGRTDAHKDFISAKSRRDAAKALGVDLGDLDAALSTFHEAEQATPEPEPAAQFVVTLRGLRQHTKDGRPFKDTDPVKAIDAALACANYDQPEPVIEWKGTDELAALDLDWHGKTPPDRQEQERIIGQAEPKPFRWWVTHGGGLRLLYRRHGCMTAKDQAAIARYVLRGVGANGIQVVSQTRHPAYPRTKDGVEQRCGGVRLYTGGGNFKRVKAQLLGTLDTDAEVDPEHVEAWLELHGMQTGGRYTHDRCTIDPSDTTATPPIEIKPDGFLCYRCQGDGVRYKGMNLPAGFVPWCVLLDDEPARITNHLRNAVRYYTHWEQVEPVISDPDVHVPLKDLKDTYRALLTLWHLEDAPADQIKDREKRIASVFERHKIVRGDGCWLDRKPMVPVSEKGLSDLLWTLPAVKGSPKIHAEFQGAFDLSDYGYVALTPIRGVDMARRTRQDRKRYYVVAQADPPFKYYSAKNCDLPWAERHILDSYPDTFFDLLRLMIAAKGVIQGGCFLNIPQIFLTGQSDARKTAHATLAAHLCCDKAQCVAGDKNRTVDRLMQLYGDACERHGFVVFNETDEQSMTAEVIRDMIKRFEDEVSYHKLYTGLHSILVPAVITYTSQSIPALLRQDAQTGKRTVHVHMGAAKEVNWFETGGNIKRWRAANELNAKAADMFVSDIINRFFREPTTWERIVAELGFKMLRDTVSSIDEDFRRFFILACQLHWPKDRYTGELGWREFHAVSDGEVAGVFNELSGADRGKEDVQPLLAHNWGATISVPGVEIEFGKPRGSRRFVRFFVRDGKDERAWWFNSQIMASKALGTFAERCAYLRSVGLLSDDPGHAVSIDAGGKPCPACGEFCYGTCGRALAG